VAYPQKATDPEIREAYEETKSIWKAGKRLGMGGQSVHERLVKMGVKLRNPKFTDAEILLLKSSYVIYRDAGKIAELATRMGREKTTICGKARTLGLTSPKHERRYYSIWKYMDEDTARVIFEDFRNTRGTMGDYCRRKGLGELGFSRTMQRHFPDEWDAVIEAQEAWLLRSPLAALRVADRPGGHQARLRALHSMQAQRADRRQGVERGLRPFRLRGCHARVDRAPAEWARGSLLADDR